MTSDPDDIEELSKRELQIAQAYGQGETYKDIAGKLFIAPTTVKTHLRTVYRKLGVSSKVLLYQALEAQDLNNKSISENQNTSGFSPFIAGKTLLDIKDKPVIAVLPFTNLSRNPDQEFFADALTEDITTRLGYLRGAVVISRASCFVFKGQSKGAREIGAELGAKYIVEGSVRTAGDRFRIMVQLIDAEKDVQLWSNRLERQMVDIFALQDEVTHAIVESLQIELTDGELARDPGGTQDLVAWELFHKGTMAHLRYTSEHILIARALFKQAYDIDSNFIDAKVFHAWTFWQHARSGFAPDPVENLAITRLRLDELLSDGTRTAGVMHLEAATLLLECRYDEALSAAIEAVSIGPSRLFGTTPAAIVYLYCGKYQEAADLMREGIRTIPYTPTDIIFNLSYVLGFLGDHALAVALAEEYMRRVPEDLYAYTLLAIAYELNGSSGKAKATMDSFRQRFPRYRLKDYVAHEPFRDKQVLHNTLNILRMTGLPE